MAPAASLHVPRQGHPLSLSGSNGPLTIQLKQAQRLAVERYCTLVVGCLFVASPFHSPLMTRQSRISRSHDFRENTNVWQLSWGIAAILIRPTNALSKLQALLQHARAMVSKPLDLSHGRCAPPSTPYHPICGLAAVTDIVSFCRATIDRN